MPSRRQFLEQGVAAAAGLSLPSVVSPASPRGTSRAYLDLGRPPDAVSVQLSTGDSALRSAGGRWSSDSGVSVAITGIPGAMRVSLASPSVAIKRLHLRWRGRLDDTRL